MTSYSRDFAICAKSGIVSMSAVSYARDCKNPERIL